MSQLLPPTTSSKSGSSARQVAENLMAVAMEFFFPSPCIDCRQRVGSLFCSTCQKKYLAPPPIKEPHSPLSERRATAEFKDKIRDALHALKYENQRRMAIALGERLYNEFQRSTWKPDLITAAPLHPSRLKTRGYNQADLLAEVLARTAELPFSPQAISRLKDTVSQVGLNAHERESNVREAFIAVRDLVEGRRILIIDDVYTTGATLRSCGTALREAGAVEVWALTVASGVYQQST